MRAGEQANGPDSEQDDAGRFGNGGLSREGIAGIIAGMKNLFALIASSALFLQIFAARARIRRPTIGRGLGREEGVKGSGRF